MRIITTQANFIPRKTARLIVWLQVPIVETLQLRRSVAVLLIIATAVHRNALAGHERRQHSLLGVAPHLLQVIIVVESVLVLEFRQTNLVAAVLVFHFFKVVLAATDDAHGTAALPRIAHVVTRQLHKVRRLVAAVAQIRARLDVVSTAIGHTVTADVVIAANIRAIVRII